MTHPPKPRQTLYRRPSERGEASTPVASPCVDICVIEPRSRLCIGCLRTMDEIASWGGLDTDTRAAIMGDLEARRPLLAQRKGGRTRRSKPDPDAV